MRPLWLSAGSERVLSVSLRLPLLAFSLLVGLGPSSPAALVFILFLVSLPYLLICWDQSFFVMDLVNENALCDEL